MANVLMPVMVVPDLWLKTSEFGAFCGQTGETSWQSATRRVHAPRCQPARKIILFGDCLAGTAKPGRKIPQLRLTVPHRQYRLGVVDVKHQGQR